MKKIALPKRSAKSTTKRKKPMAKRRKKAVRRNPTKTTRARRRASKSMGKRQRVTVYKRGGKYYAPRKSGRYRPTLFKKMKMNPRRRIRRNPSFSLKKMLNTKLVINGSLIAGGFIAGSFVANKIREMVPQLSMLGKFSGAVNIVAGLLGASLVKGEKAKMVSLGMVASGAYDIIQMNIMPMISPTAPAMGYHGLPRVGFHDKMQSYQNVGSDMSLLGSDASLLGSDASLLGDDLYEHEYMDIEDAF